MLGIKWPFLFEVSTKVPSTNFVPYSKNPSTSSGGQLIAPQPASEIISALSKIVFIYVTLAVSLQGRPKSPVFTVKSLFPTTVQL